MIPAVGSSRHPTMEFNRVNGLNTAQSTDTPSVRTAPHDVPSRPSPFGSPIRVSEGPSGLKGTNDASSAKSEPTNNYADREDEENADNDFSVPKDLEIIVEKLGVNPRAKASDGKKDSTKEFGILACEEADKDEDIITLAEFAVEQHNAMNKNSKMSLSRVLGACLEAVHHGRYHIVLETKDATGVDKPLRFYAVVLHRRTDRQTLMLLENWLPDEPKSIGD